MAEANQRGQHPAEASDPRIRIELSVTGSQQLRASEAQTGLLQLLRSRDSDPRQRWDAIDWDESAKTLRLSCTAAEGELGSLGETAIKSVAWAVRSLLPHEEAAVRVVSASVLVPERGPVAPDIERWGRYLVVLVVEGGSWLRDDPEAAPYIAKELKNWRRFDSASFAWDSSSAVMSVEVPVARSAGAAEGEARDTLNNLIWAAVKEPGEYAIRPLRVEWLSET